MKLLTALLGLALTLSLAGCSDSPSDTIVDRTDMRIYKVIELKDQSRSKYEYWIRDASAWGWTFQSDRQFAEGDYVSIELAPAPKNLVPAPK